MAELPRRPQLAFNPTAMRSALLRWYRPHARPLPWRRSHNPYKVWVSEIMLQQTQVATVIPYYRRFMRAFPSVQALACAPLERVLELWSGLGYYRRARNLHEAARVIAQLFSKRFPTDYREACLLPGVGEYTARAVLSIAYNQPHAVLDGNVARVVARLKALQGNLHQTEFRRAVEHDLNLLLSREKPGEFNQALMELGQMVCLPRAPRCSICPLRNWCQAYRQCNAESYPAPRPRRPAEPHYLAAAVVRRGSKVAMMRGLDQELLGDLWNFPAAFGRSRADALARLRAKLATTLQGSISWPHPDGPRAEVRHGITYRAIHVNVYPADVSGAISPLRWIPVSKFSQAAVSQLARKIAAQISSPQGEVIQGLERLTP